jgi:aryl-phospho-beta-D-glucosidase BglC (GH1 family)
MYKKILILLIILLILCLKTDPASALGIKSIVPNENTVEQYNKFELTLDLFDVYVAPEDLKIEATFTGPIGGDITVGGFYSHGRYKIRFTPTATGRYFYRVTVQSGRYNLRSPLAGFNCLPVTKNKYGFLKPWKEDPHRLVFDNGQHFYILGENRFNIYAPSWNYGNKNIQSYISYMAENGMNTLRVFIRCARNPNDPTRVGYLEQKVGTYDEDTADQLDNIIEACQKNDIYVILTVFALGFTPHDDFKDWNNNPYNVQNGGPCQERTDFFNLPEAIGYQEKKLRYIVNRYGYSPNLLSIDLFNEPEWDGGISESIWIPWAIGRSEYIKKIDPYKHLVTLGSVGPQWNIRGYNEDDWYKNALNDTIQWHQYNNQSVDDVAYKMRNFIRKYWGYNKPLYCGEFAWGEEPKPAYDHTHNGIWAAIMSGGGVLAHSAPAYNTETDELMFPARAAHFKALALFLKDVPWEKNLEYKAAGIVADSPQIKVWGLSNNDYTLVWLLDGDKKKYGQKVNSLTLTVADLAEGEYIVEWWDTRQGAVIDKEKVSCRNNMLKAAIPSFEKDIACKIKAVVK